MTGTEVYGSDDTTGAGGDWDLEAVSIGGEHELASETIAPLNVAALSAYQGTLSEPTLVAHWTFDDASGQTLTDITGNGNDGTLGSTAGADANNPTWTTDGTRGSVLTFDGNQDYVTGIGNSPSGSFTVAGWANITSGVSDYHAMYSADTEIWLGVHDASGFIYMYAGGDGNYVDTANNSWTHSTWHHLAGNAAGTDIDPGDSLTFSLTNDAGGRFAIDLNTGQLTVADGSLLNFEAASSHGITVRVTDSGGLSYDKSFIVGVNDINEAPTAIDE